MKLSTAEMALIKQLAEREEESGARSAPGIAGSREMPLSYADLLQIRRRKLGCGNG